MSKLVASGNKEPKCWTSLVTVAVSNLNGQPRARKGAWSAPDLIAEGVVNPDAMLLLKDIGSPAAAMARTMRILSKGYVTRYSQVVDGVECNKGLHELVCIVTFLSLSSRQGMSRSLSTSVQHARIL